jgi:hypothetical protein
MLINENTTGNTLKITTVGEPDTAPVQKEKIRVPQFRGVWDAEAVEDGKLRIEYTLDLDPGGSLPAGIVNLFVAKGPYETFINLSRLLKN